MYTELVLHILLLSESVFSALNSDLGIPAPKNFAQNVLQDHTMVTDTNVFPYVCAILKKSVFISSGALIDESWVLTGGDALYLLRDTARELRVRLGSVNIKKGGILTPIKFFEIHPYFKDTTPEFDIALIKLPKPVQITSSLNPIRLQKMVKDISATHFIVTSWPAPVDKTSDELQRLRSMEMIKRRRILTVSHLHPSDPDKCAEEMGSLELNATDSLMCLDPAIGSEPCARDIGAPVVLNGVLWGIISSWKPANCEIVSGSSFVTLVAAPDVSSWLHSTVRGNRWKDNSSQPQNRMEVDESYYDETNGYNDDDYT